MQPTHIAILHTNNTGHDDVEYHAGHEEQCALWLRSAVDDLSYNVSVEAAYIAKITAIGTIGLKIVSVPE